MVVSSEFQWLWLVAVNRSLQRDGLWEVDVSDEIGGSNIEGRRSGTV